MVYIITGDGALRRHAWNYRPERELNRANVPGQLSFITYQICTG